MNKKFLFALFLTLVLTVNGWTQQEKRLKFYTTYQTNLTNEDIMRSFVNEVRSYLQSYNVYGCYYWVGYEVFHERDKQNYAWRIDVVEQVYREGTIHTVMLSISNAVLRVKFCNTSFNTFGQSSREIITTRPETVGGNMIRENIVNTATSMFNESEMVLKMYKGNL